MQQRSIAEDFCSKIPYLIPCYDLPLIAYGNSNIQLLLCYDIQFNRAIDIKKFITGFQKRIRIKLGYKTKEMHNIRNNILKNTYLRIQLIYSVTIIIH